MTVDKSDGQDLPIHRLIVAFVTNYFRRQVIGCSAQRPRLVGDSFRKAEISDFEMTMSIEKKVFRLQVPIYDIFRVQILEREGNFSGIEFGNRVGEALSETAYISWVMKHKRSG